MQEKQKIVYSDKVFLENNSFPVKAFIFFQKGIISNIIVPSSSSEVSLIFEKEKILNFEGFYVLPGLIDLNIRFNGEWEGLQKGTLSAAKGGITTVALEANYHELCEPRTSALHCDVGLIARVLSESDFPSHSQPLAYKTYLLPQSESVIGSTDLSAIMAKCSELSTNLIVDASLAKNRLLHIASPYRTKHTTLRLSPGPIASVGDYSMAVDLSISDCASESDSAESSSFSSTGTEVEVPQPNETHRHRRQFSIELAEKVGKLQLCFKELSEAELETYSSAGRTLFRSGTTEGKEATRPGLSRLRTMRPPQLSILKRSVDESSYNNYLMNVPASWECAGIDHVLECLHEHSSLTVHFSNLASAEAVSALVRARELYCNVTIETCPHYLWFSSADIKSKQTALKTFPPIRTPKNREILQKFLINKGIDTVCSHHNPVDRLLKTGEFRSALPGLSCVGSSLSAVWSVLKAAVEVTEAINIILDTMCYKPAELLGINKTKGGISIGKQADLIVWNPYEPSSPYSAQSVYKGQPLYGKVEKVYIKGKRVKKNRFCGSYI